MRENHIKDITIIGGGAAGLYAAFYAGMRDLSVRMIESDAKLGGKVHFYPEKLIWDVGGVTPIIGADLIDQMIEQGLTFEPEVVCNQKIIHVEKDSENIFTVESESGQTFMSKTVIVATGGGIFHPKKLAVENSEYFEETNLHYSVYRMSDFKDKKVVIVGGGNSAIDWANNLYPIAKEVHLVHRRDQFKAHESQVRKLKESGATIYTCSSIKKLVSTISSKRIQAVNILNHSDQTETQVLLDELVVNIGFDMEKNFHQKTSLGLELEDDYYIKGQANTRTDVEGLYAIGDILTFEGKVRLIAGAYNDAANAVNQIKLSLDPTAAEKAQVSSHNDVFNDKNQEKLAYLYK